MFWEGGENLGRSGDSKDRHTFKEVPCRAGEKQGPKGGGGCGLRDTSALCKVFRWIRRRGEAEEL